LQHGKDIQNVTHEDHPVYGKALDNGNQYPVCEKWLKFAVYQQNTGHEQFDCCGKTSSAQASAIQLALANQVTAQSSVVLPSSMQYAEAGHADNANFRILPQISMSQTIESVGLQSLSFTVCHIWFESSGDAKFGHLSNFAETPYFSTEGVLFATSEGHYQHLKPVNF